MLDQERHDSDGKFRAGEAKALTSVCDVADKYPALVAGLADKDGGEDPEVFETDLLRDHLQRAAELGPVSDGIAVLAQKIGDTVLHFGEATKPIMLQAYGLVKPQAAVNPDIKTMLAPAMSFYSRIGRLAAETRKRNKKA
jgi:hypothetical protein